MDNSFFAYLKQIELMVFFSGYPLVYAISVFIATLLNPGNNFSNRLVSVLPFAYALLGTLYLGFLLKILSPDYSIEHLRNTIQQPYLVGWGLLSILFWIPALAKKTVLSLLHSLIFFFILLKDLFSQVSLSSNSIIKNDMNVYTTSILLNTGSLALMILLSYLVLRNRVSSQS
jgi:hypothetical protein